MNLQETPMTPEPDLFHLWHPVEVRFKDIDLGGHAHHSHALVYFEEARARYWKDVVRKGSLEEVEFVLAEARVRYHGRIFYPMTLQVGVRVSRIGRKHFVMEYLAVDPRGKPLASGETTMVMFDYDQGKSRRIPEAVAQAMRAHEGETLK
jgi:acyl-CoA thioester hydrolase